MAVAVQSPNAVARTLTTALHRPITSKAVRTMARATLARFDKSKHPEYQSHAYSASEVSTLREAFVARGSRSVAQPKRKAPAKRATPRKAPVTKTTVA
jgi:phage gpG-like protein